MDFADKVVVVTGGAQGLGRAVVERFLAAGAKGVVAVDLPPHEPTAASQQTIESYEGQLLSLSADVSDPEQVGRMVETTVSRFGQIDILVNNAGICPVVDWEDVTLDNWNQILAVNLTGMFICTQAIIPHLRARGGGRIVFVSSPAAYVGSIVAHVGYGVSKAGIIALMKSVAKRFAADGILANAIAPGPIDTPLSHSFGPEFWDATRNKTLLKRHAEASEIADSVLFLASDHSSYITGHVLWVDGGYSLT